MTGFIELNSLPPDLIVSQSWSWRNSIYQVHFCQIFSYINFLKFFKSELSYLLFSFLDSANLCLNRKDDTASATCVQMATKPFTNSRGGSAGLGFCGDALVIKTARETDKSFLQTL